MFFRTAFVALLASFASAEERLIMEGDIPVNSEMGQNLLMKATVVEEARILGNNNNQYQWMADYSIRYTGCSDLVQVAGQNGNNNKNDNGGNNMVYTQHLVKFSLCPSSACDSKCAGGGQYVVSMGDFVDMYTESKMQAQELQCENTREACYCDDANDDDACEYACYVAAGIESYCVQYEGQDQFEVQRYLECAELKDNNKNNNNNNQNNYNNGGDFYYGQYYVGPYCPDGKNIYMGLYYDQGCSAKADVSQYATRMGSALPYASTSIVTLGDCISCLDAENNNNNNNNNNGYKIAELCSTSWYEAAHCEQNMTITYPDASGCDYINNILPKLTAASMSIANPNSSTAYSKKSGKAAKAFAFIFAFTTVLFAAYAYFLYRKIKRGVVALSAQGN